MANGGCNPFKWLFNEDGHRLESRLRKGANNLRGAAGVESSGSGQPAQTVETGDEKSSGSLSLPEQLREDGYKPIGLYAEGRDGHNGPMGHKSNIGGGIEREV